MVVSIHLVELPATAAVAMLLRPPQPRRIPGLLYAETTTTAPLGEPLLPPRQLRRVGMIAAWESDAALEAFSRRHPLAARLGAGWEARLQPLRAVGSWAGLRDLPRQALAVEPEEPVGILTLGQLRLLRSGAFRRSAGPAESAALGDPALLAGVGLARLPRLVATFSLWRSAVAMRRFATGPGGAHSAAMQADRQQPFHHESAFVRLRPYASRGSWDGCDPLAGLLGERAAGKAG